MNNCYDMAVLYSAKPNFSNGAYNPNPNKHYTLHVNFTVTDKLSSLGSYCTANSVSPGTSQKADFNINFNYVMYIQYTPNMRQDKACAPVIIK